jgi:hypothetical protein
LFNAFAEITDGGVAASREYQVRLLSCGTGVTSSVPVGVVDARVSSVTGAKDSEEVFIVGDEGVAAKGSETMGIASLLVSLKSLNGREGTGGGA